MKTLADFILSINNVPLQKACLKIPLSPHSMFGMWPASLGHHHAYAGGLLVHTLEVCQIADAILKSGGVRVRARDHVIAACLWHDVAKIEEYVLVSPEQVPSGHRSIPAFGNLVWTKAATIKDGEHPHIQAGADTFRRTAVTHQVAVEVIEHIESCILSHHGRVEWGAVFEPKTEEAELVHYADMLSARMGVKK